MSAQYETGHARNVANFQKLMEQVGVFAEYNPSVAGLTLENLNTLYSQGLAAVNEVEAARIAYKNAVHARQETYEPLSPTATRIINHLELLNLPSGTEAQARSLVNSIRGTQPPKKEVPDDPDVATRTVSTSRRSYTQMAENFSKLLQLLGTIPSYTPNTEDLKHETLTAYYNQMVGNTQTVDQTEAALNKAIIARDTVLYAEATGLYTIAQNVKKYVKSLYGTTSTEYEKVVRIAFTTQ